MAAISSDFFGLCLLGPIETNFSGEPLLWPAWYPTSWRAIDNYGGVPPNYSYLEGISQWPTVQLNCTFTIAASAATFTCPGATQLFANGQTTQPYGSIPAGFTAGNTYYVINVSALTFQLSSTFNGPAVTTSSGSSGSCQIFEWSLMDLVWEELLDRDVNNVVFSFEYIPYWASVGNSYSFACTITVPGGTAGVVTATGNNFANGWQVFFSGGTVPGGLALGNSTNPGTFYYVVNYGTDGTGKFRLSLTLGGAAIITTGSAGTSTIVAVNSPPSSMTYITNWVTSYLTRATANGLSIKFIEGVNEANNGYSQGFSIASMTEMVTMQQTIHDAAKAYDSTIQILSPPVNGFTVGGSIGPGILSGGYTFTQSFLANGGGAYCDIIAFHGYPPGTLSQVTYSTDLAAFVAMLAANGAGLKPLWNTEYSSLAAVPATDETYLSTTTFLDLSNGVVRKYYYAYDSGTDILWVTPTTGVPGVLNVAGIAYQQLMSWLVGLTMVAPVSTSGVIMSCDFSGNGGYMARAIWTTDGSTPSYTTPSWVTQYRTLAGGVVINPGATVTLGANPIWLEGTHVSVASRNIGWCYAA